eukprot:TRINITY_DN1160_c1_g1_i1.p1 TRINITY_DN1160_c1_g1~~TRINITY_DN1160_c1_g1_i1.p1  ORF type:complete len:203 (-),score=13.02 TRINITY_DN1160_c1_g1_i1:4-612(-)
MDTNGIIHFLGCQLGQVPPSQWRNPVEHGLVRVTSSRLVRDSRPAWSIVGRSTVRCACKPESNNWMCIDLLKYYVNPTKYTLRHYLSWDTECLRNWVLEASQDGQTFRTIKEHSNDESLKGKGDTATWSLDNYERRRYRAFRIRQTGPNSNNHKYLALSGFEIYGEYRCIHRYQFYFNSKKKKKKNKRRRRLETRPTDDTRE